MTDVPSSDEAALQERLTEYRRIGYTVFRNVHPPERIHQWRQLHPQLARHAGTDDVTDLLEYAPHEFLPAMNDPVLLDFAERVMGPRVQLDSIHFRHDRSQPPHQRMKPTWWHRDMYATFSTGGHYQHPLAVNVITYLQDLTDEYGPFRVIEGSHLTDLSIPTPQRTSPHAREKLLYLKAGDALFTHNGVWHSGTLNTAPQPRYFLSVYYTNHWLPQRDNFKGPAIQRLIADARSRKDLRMLRLLGVDERRIHRAYETGMEPDEAVWTRWLAEDARRD